MRPSPLPSSEERNQLGILRRRLRVIPKLRRPNHLHARVQHNRPMLLARDAQCTYLLQRCRAARSSPAHGRDQSLDPPARLLLSRTVRVFDQLVPCIAAARRLAGFRYQQSLGALRPTIDPKIHTWSIITATTCLVIGSTCCQPE